MADSKRDFEALLKRLSAPVQPVVWSGAPELAPGLMVEASYRIVRLLGRGGMGEVYEAEHLSSQARVALKCLLQGLAEEPSARARFEAEAQAVSQLRHPNIVDVFATGSLPDGRAYLCMELLEGQTLQARLEQQGPIAEPRLLQIGMSLCDALGAAHARGIVHRDLKPQNVFLVSLGVGGEQVKLTDFGVAKLLEQPGTQLTTTGLMLGTPHFMAPEQIRGERHVDARIDVYALGVLLYYCVSGKLPFEGRTFAELAVRICSEPPKPLQGVSTELAASITLAMHKEPSARFSSAEALKTALAEVVRARSAALQ